MRRRRPSMAHTKPEGFRRTACRYAAHIRRLTVRITRHSRILAGGSAIRGRRPRADVLEAHHPALGLLTTLGATKRSHRAHALLAGRRGEHACQSSPGRSPAWPTAAQSLMHPPVIAPSMIPRVANRPRAALELLESTADDVQRHAGQRAADDRQAPPVRLPSCRARTQTKTGSSPRTRRSIAFGTGPSREAPAPPRMRARRAR